MGGEYAESGEDFLANLYPGDVPKLSGAMR
jgi:hypothetical protein